VNTTTTHPRGNSYDDTVGRVIDYEKLAAFLIDCLLVTRQFRGVWDVPCGTGRLLSAMRKHCPDVPLFGLDISPQQLETARSRSLGCTLYENDVFALPDVMSASGSNRAFVHVGFCFFNSIPHAARVSLLSTVFQTPGAAGLGFEIQNSQFQEACFVCGKWYTQKLSSGGFLRSRSTRIAPDKKDLELEFLTDSGKRTVNERIFDWPVEQCVSDCFAAGWFSVERMKATYRETEHNLNSHWFVVCRKESA